MTAPYFRKLTRDEYERLPLDARLEYMRRLIDHVRQLVAETRERVEAIKKKHPDSA